MSTILFQGLGRHRSSHREELTSKDSRNEERCPLFVVGGTVIQSVGFNVFQNLVKIWSRMGTILVSFDGVVYMWVCGAHFTPEPVHTVL